MELIIISESKLKIMLTRDDMQHYALDAASVNYDNTETRKAFWNILDEVKHQTGFDAASDRVFIQMYPSREGGCELFVTKVGLVCGADESCDQKPVPVNEKGALLSTQPTPQPCFGREKRDAYVFENLDALLCVCRRLLAMGFAGESAAYRDEEKKYYLMLSRARESTFVSPDMYSFISEYGSPQDMRAWKLYINEHGDCFCPARAVEALGTL